jgi:hypothetical protein
MSENEVTEQVTPSGEQVTAPAGEAPVGEAVSQESNERLAKLEAELQAFATRVEQETKARTAAEAKAVVEEKARQEAEKERDREVKIRIGHQRESGPKLQRLSELEKQIASQTALDEKLSRLEGLVEAMATNSLDSESIERINVRIAQAQKDKELERLRNEVQHRSQPAPRQDAPELTPAWKKQLKDELFSEFDVDPLELSDEEWHQYDSRDSNHWQSQVRAEFKKRHVAKQQQLKPAVPDADEIKKIVAAQVEEQVKAQREEDSKKLAESKAENEELRKANEESKRVYEEQLLRAKGVDRGHETVPGAPAEKSIAKELAKLNPQMLYSKDPADREAYAKARDNDKVLRDKILDHARRVQAQK